MLLFPKTSKTTTANGYLLYAHSKQTKSSQNKPIAKGTKHSKLSTVCKTHRPKSRKGPRAHSAQQKQKWSAERYALNAEGDKGHTGYRARNARRNGNVTDGKSGEHNA